MQGLLQFHRIFVELVPFQSVELDVSIQNLQIINGYFVENVTIIADFSNAGYSRALYIITTAGHDQSQALDTLQSED